MKCLFCKNKTIKNFNLYICSKCDIEYNYRSRIDIKLNDYTFEHEDENYKYDIYFNLNTYELEIFCNKIIDDCTTQYAITPTICVNSGRILSPKEIKDKLKTLMVFK